MARREDRAYREYVREEQRRSGSFPAILRVCGSDKVGLVPRVTFRIGLLTQYPAAPTNRFEAWQDALAESFRHGQ